jgi:hypothetical protein
MPHITVAAWRATMPRNAMMAQQTTMPHIIKMVWCKMATPIAKVARQTTLPHIPVAVRPKTILYDVNSEGKRGIEVYLNKQVVFIVFLIL